MKIGYKYVWFVGLSGDVNRSLARHKRRPRLAGVLSRIDGGHRSWPSQWSRGASRFLHLLTEPGNGSPVTILFDDRYTGRFSCRYRTCSIASPSSAIDTATRIYWWVCLPAWQRWHTGLLTVARAAGSTLCWRCSRCPSIAIRRSRCGRSRANWSSWSTVRYAAVLISCSSLLIDIVAAGAPVRCRSRQIDVCHHRDCVPRFPAEGSVGGAALE